MSEMENRVEPKAENQALVLMPLVDILDGSEGVTMWFEVPGANSKTVTVEVKDRIMTMKAASTLRRNEFQLSDGIDVEKISAKTQDGVLVLELPKADSAKVHRITVE